MLRMNLPMFRKLEDTTNMVLVTMVAVSGLILALALPMILL